MTPRDVFLWIAMAALVSILAVLSRAYWERWLPDEEQE